METIKREPLYPPCAIGDTVYGFGKADEDNDAFIEELEVRAVMYDGVRWYIVSDDGAPLEFGVDVALTREDAETAIYGP